jgi:hypothetical protein
MCEGRGEEVGKDGEDVEAHKVQGTGICRRVCDAV